MYRNLSANLLKKSLIPHFSLHFLSLRLHGIIFPALHNLLLSTTDLVDLHLLDVPPFCSIPPGELAYYLSNLIRLEDLRLAFFLLFLDDNQNGLLTRVDLLHLTCLDINGPITYLEDFVARINTPLLRVFQVMFYGEPVHLDTPQLTDFIGRAERFKVLDQAGLHFDSDAFENSDNITVKLSLRKRPTIAQFSNYKATSTHQEGAFWPWHKPVAHSHPSSPLWNTSALLRIHLSHCFSLILWRMHGGCNFYAHLPA